MDQHSKLRPSGQHWSWEDYQAQRYFPFLDGLRAVAVLGTVAHHLRNEPLAWLHGNRGVTVFFVLSGFLITTLALREEQERGRLDVRAFFVRRAFRILPLYYLVLSGYLVLVLVGLDDRREEFLRALPFYALYLQEWPVFTWGQELPFALSWSLGVEEKFYLVWPVVAFVWMRRSPHRLAVCLVLAAVSVALSYASPGEPQLFGSYAHILLGAALAVALHRRETYQALSSRVVGTRLPALLSLLVAALWAAPLPAEVLFSAAVTAALGAVLLAGPSVQSRLSAAPLVRIGTLSYAVYLTHNIALNVVERLVPESFGTLGDIATLLPGLALCLAGSAVLHRVVERPAIVLGRRLSRRPAPVDRPVDVPA